MSSRKGLRVPLGTGALRDKLTQSGRSSSRRAEAILSTRKLRLRKARELGRNTASQGHICVRAAKANALVKGSWLWSEEPSQMVEQVVERTAIVEHTSPSASVPDTMDNFVAVATSHMAAHLPIAGRSMGSDLPPDLLLHSF